MKERVLITGASGLLAKNLAKKLTDSGYHINYLTTSKKNISNNTFYWDYSKNYIDIEALYNVSHIIHLAGFNINNNWSAKNKKLMLDSRVQTSNLIFDKCKELNIRLQTFISASAMGYYGFNQFGIKTENSEPGNDWMAKLCVKWERAADKFKTIGARVIKLRLSLVLDNNAEILLKSCISFRFGFGVVFGNGRQPFPWIHISDVIKFIHFGMKEKKLSGVFNLTSPQNISHYDFIKAIQKTKYKNAKIIYAPGLIISLLFPKKKVLLFNEFVLSSKKATNNKYQWLYPNIEDALNDLFNL